MSSPLLSVVGGITLTTCIVLVLSTLAVSLALNLYRNRAARLRHTLSAKLVQYSALAIFIIRTLMGWAYLTHAIYVVSIDYGSSLRSRHSGPVDVFYGIFSFVVGISSYTALYFFWVWRLHITFQNSVYAVKPIVIRIHMLNYALMLFAMLPLAALIEETGGAYRSRFKVLVPVLSLWNTLALTHLVFAFNGRLFRLVLSQRQTVMGRTDASSLSERQISILSVVRKHTVLGSVIVLSQLVRSTFTLLALALTDNYYLVMDIYPSSQAYIIVFDLVYALCLCVDGTGIYLGFTVNQRYYDKICGPLDAKCKILCENMVQRTMYRDAQNDGEADAKPSGNTHTKVASMTGTEIPETPRPEQVQDNEPWLNRMQSSAI